MLQTTPAYDLVLERLRASPQPLSTSELVGLGATRTTLARMCKDGLIARSVRGVYRLPGDEKDSRSLWADISVALPHAVFCLDSAAAYHGITQNMGGVLNIAIPTSQKSPSEDSTGGVRTRFVRWRPGELFETGIDTVTIDGTKVRITGAERTVVDMFRHSVFERQSRGAETLIDPETFHDCLTRYLFEYEGGTSGSLRKIAKELGVWARLEPHVTMAGLNYQRAPSI